MLWALISAVEPSLAAARKQTSPALGAALLTIEATAVVPEGRITYADLGFWNERCYVAMGLVLESIRRWTDFPIGLQLSHAGRKASTEVPWKGGGQISPTEALGWQTVAPSELRYSKGMFPPDSLDKEGLKRVRDAFAAAARRTAKLGLDLVQVHAAHGFSPPVPLSVEQSPWR